MIHWTHRPAPKPGLPEVWTAEVTVQLGTERTAAIRLRIVPRPEKFDVDMHSVGPWEQIEDWRNPPRTFDDAKAYAERWLAAANEQKTLTPRVPS